jgi:hypothetical protein
MIVTPLTGDLTGTPPLPERSLWGAHARRAVFLLVGGAHPPHGESEGGGKAEDWERDRQ